MKNQDKKLNCWEFKKCGREAGGAKAKELGVCPATEDEKLNTVHGGKNAGRSCWVLAGTMCGGKVQGRHLKNNIYAAQLANSGSLGLGLLPSCEVKCTKQLK
jgi:hypothetical protein